VCVCVCVCVCVESWLKFLFRTLDEVTIMNALHTFSHYIYLLNFSSHAAEHSFFPPTKCHAVYFIKFFLGGSSNIHVLRKR
jgi:hypothetical protein